MGADFSGTMLQRLRFQGVVGSPHTLEFSIWHWWPNPLNGGRATAKQEESDLRKFPVKLVCRRMGHAPAQNGKSMGNGIICP